MSDLLKELCLVEAVNDITDGQDVALKGSRGTVVEIVRGGVAYYVEFTEPRHVVVCASRLDLKERR